MHSPRRLLGQSKNLNIAAKIIAVLAIIAPASGLLHAQQVYKSVDKNGRVTYSEVPPLPGPGDKLTGDSAANVALPTPCSK